MNEWGEEGSAGSRWMEEERSNERQLEKGSSYVIISIYTYIYIYITHLTIKKSEIIYETILLL